ncbi:hypothetical protein BC833DRAFT_607144, partial [Globomyces pollinis-pini]
MDQLDNLIAEVDDFEEFVKDFEMKMNDIVSGKALEDEKKKKLQSASNKKLTNTAESQPTITGTKQTPETKDEDIHPKNDIKIESKATVKKEPIRNRNGKIDYSAWNQLDDSTPPTSPKMTSKSANELNNKPSNAADIKTKNDLESEPTTNTFHRKYVEQSVNRYKENGKSFYTKKQYDMAIEQYTLAINTSQNPTSDVLPPSKEGDVFQFIDNLIKPSPIPIDANLYVNRSLCYFKLNNYKDSLSDCQEAITLNPNLLKAWYRKSQCERYLKEYQNSKSSLQQCVAILSNQVEDPKLISKKELEREITMMEQLIQDQFIETEEKSQLLESDDHQLMKNTLVEFDKLLNYRDINNNEYGFKFKTVTNVIVQLLRSHASMQHSFRILNGYSMLLSKTVNPCAEWLSVLLSSVKNHPENQRCLAEQINQLKFLIVKMKDTKEWENNFISILEMFNESKTLWMSFDVDVNYNSEIGLMIQSYFNSKSDSNETAKAPTLNERHSNVLFTWLKNQTDENMNKLQRYQITIPWLLNITIEWLSIEVKSAHLLLNLFSIVFNYSKSTIKSVQTEFKLKGKLVALSLTRYINRLDDEESVKSSLTLIYNTLFVADGPYIELFDQSGWITQLISLVEKSTFKSLAVKILAKLAKHHEVLLSKYLPHINWNICENDLSQILTESTKDLVGDWTQLLALFLKSTEKSISRFLDRNGMDLSVSLLKQASLNVQNYGRIVGNCALILSSCCNCDKSIEQLLHRHFLELVIEIFTKLNNQSVISNLSLCCAKICKNEKGLKRARELNLIPILYSVNAKK